jgi:hypothetical protein
MHEDKCKYGMKVIRRLLQSCRSPFIINERKEAKPRGVTKSVLVRVEKLMNIGAISKANSAISKSFEE